MLASTITPLPQANAPGNNRVVEEKKYLSFGRSVFTNCQNLHSEEQLVSVVHKLFTMRNYLGHQAIFNLSLISIFRKFPYCLRHRFSFLDLLQCKHVSSCDICGLGCSMLVQALISSDGRNDLEVRLLLFSSIFFTSTFVCNLQENKQ